MRRMHLMVALPLVAQARSTSIPIPCQVITLSHAFAMLHREVPTLRPQRHRATETKT